LKVGKALGYVSHPSNTELFASECWVCMPSFVLRTIGWLRPVKNTN
jgi:hypothetical protein